MEKDNLDNLFNQLQGTFDIEEPKVGHQARFLDRLQKANLGTTKIVDINERKKSWLKPLSIAACLIILLSVGISYYNNSPSVDEQVAEISPEVSRTRFYFASLIDEQVKELERVATPETQQIIADTMSQLQRLQSNYQTLESELLKGGDSRLILSAMITNFQTRIDLLKEVLGQIDAINNLKNRNDANYTI